MYSNVLNNLMSIVMKIWIQRKKLTQLRITTKEKKDTHTDKNQIFDERGKKSKGPKKKFLDKGSEKAELSNNTEYHSSILNPNYRPVDTGLFFYATMPGDCYFECFDENQFPEKIVYTIKNNSKKSTGQKKKLLDKRSEKAELSNNSEYHSSILNPNHKPVDTELFFYANMPGECYFEYSDEDQFPEKKIYTIKNEYKIEKNSHISS